MSGPADIALTFGSYPIPLAVLELYFAAQRSGCGLAQALMAALLGVAAACTEASVFGTIALMWAPYI